MPQTFDYRDWCRRRWKGVDVEGNGGPWGTICRCASPYKIRLADGRGSAEADLETLGRNGCGALLCDPTKHRLLCLQVSAPASSWKQPGAGIDEDDD